MYTDDEEYHYGRGRRTERPMGETIDYESLGRRIKYYRTAAGLTQAELAEKVGISIQYMSAIENGKKYPSLALLVDTSLALNVSTDALLADSIPAVKYTGDPELDELFSDCDSAERAFLIGVMKAAKEAVQKGMR